MILKDDEVLVVKHREQDVHYAFPGGHMEKGENPEECIVREIEEELGVKLESPKLAYVYTWNGNDGVVNVEFFFVVEEGQEFGDLEAIKNKNRSHAFEIFDMQWVNKESVFNILPTKVFQDFKESGSRFNGVKFINN